jgi:hypothetical protein
VKKKCDPIRIPSHTPAPTAIELAAISQQHRPLQPPPPIRPSTSSEKSKPSRPPQAREQTSKGQELREPKKRF